MSNSFEFVLKWVLSLHWQYTWLNVNCSEMFLFLWTQVDVWQLYYVRLLNSHRCLDEHEFLAIYGALHQSVEFTLHRALDFSCCLLIVDLEVCYNFHNGRQTHWGPSIYDIHTEGERVQAQVDGGRGQDPCGPPHRKLKIESMWTSTRGEGGPAHVDRETRFFWMS